MLVGVKTEGAEIAEAAAGPATVGLADSLGGVLDQLEAVARDQVQHRVYVHRQPVDMHHHDGLGVRGDLGFDLGDVHVPGQGVGVHQDGGSAGTDDLVDAGNDGEGGQNHLIARPDTQRFDRRIQRRRAIAHRDAMLTPATGGERLLKALDERPLRRDPAGVDALGEVFLLVAVE